MYIEMVSNGVTMRIRIKFKNTKGEEVKILKKDLPADLKFHLTIFIFLIQIQNPEPTLWPPLDTVFFRYAFHIFTSLPLHFIFFPTHISAYPDFIIYRNDFLKVFL